MKRLMWTLAVAMAAAWTAQAQFSGVTNTITLPAGFENIPGNDSSSYPLGAGSGGRVHQLYYGSVFGTADVLKVTELRFRLQEGSSSLDAIVPRITFTMSTYVRPLNEFTAFTRDWHGVHGPDARVVYDGSDVRLTATAAPRGLASPFDLVFPLGEPFYFDPKAGHLLIEFDAPLGVPNRTLDAQFTMVGPGETGVWLGPNAPIGGGLVSQIRYEVVPEPSISAFLAISAMAGIVLARRRQR